MPSGYSNDLCNPTPFDVKLRSGRVRLRIPKFGKIKLEAQQVHDYRGGHPGSEAVQLTLDYHGLFVRNHDIDYDEQALTSLKASHAAKKERYGGMVSRLRNERVRASIPATDEDMEDTIEQLGYKTTREQFKDLEAMIKVLEDDIAENPRGFAGDRLDPDMTIFVMDPPQPFDSRAMMKAFLAHRDNVDIAAQHQAWLDAKVAPAVEDEPDEVVNG